MPAAFRGIMYFFKLLLPVLVAVGAPSHENLQGGPLYEACAQDPYFNGKHGFPTVVQAKNEAFLEFQREVRHGRLDPRHQEFFTYLYTLTLPGHHPVFFHTQWRAAAYLGTDHGSMKHTVIRPYDETDQLRVYSLMHSHPTALKDGAGPSRVDVATASRFKNPDGSYRYLYLINNRGRLVQFKARRDIDPADNAELAKMPVKPRAGVDWLD